MRVREREVEERARKKAGGNGGNGGGERCGEGETGETCVDADEREGGLRRVLVLQRVGGGSRGEGGGEGGGGAAA